MIIVRAIVVADPLARANVCDALAGAGAPAGVVSCSVEGDTIALAFDDERTDPQVIDALIAIEVRFVPERAAPCADLAAAAATVARLMPEPELDAARAIETYLP